MGQIVSGGSGTAGGANGNGGGSVAYTFKNVVESISKGDFVTLDVSTGTVQRANDINATLFGQNGPGAATAMVLNAWGTQFNAKVYDNPDGTLLFVESVAHTGMPNGTPQLIKVAADGTAILKTITLPSNSGGSPCLVPLSGERLACLHYEGPGQMGVKVYDTHTLDLLVTKSVSFTGGTTNPFSQAGDAIETGNGQIVCHWAYGSVRFYAVLNPDLSVKTNPTSAGSMQSSFAVLQRLRLSNGHVVLATRWYDGAYDQNSLIHFDQDGVYVNAHSVGSNTTTLLDAAHVDKLRDRTARYVVEVGVNQVAFCYTNTSGRFFRKLDISTNTATFDTSLGDNNHQVTWCVHGSYAYVLSHYNSGSPMVLKAAVFNLSTNTVARALSTLIASVSSSYGLGFSAAFLHGDSAWWVLGVEHNANVGGNLFWWAFTIGDGNISVKVERTSITSTGLIQDLLVSNDEVLCVYGGNTYGGTNYASVNFCRIGLANGAFIGGYEIRPHQSGPANLFGLSASPEAKILFRPSMETAVLFGYGAGAANNVLSRVRFKPNSSILLGVARMDSAAGEVPVMLSGWVNVSDRYRTFQKTIDHTAQNGNKAKTYGPAAYLSGSF